MVDAVEVYPDDNSLEGLASQNSLREAASAQEKNLATLSQRDVTSSVFVSDLCAVTIAFGSVPGEAMPEPKHVGVFLSISVLCNNAATTLGLEDLVITKRDCPERVGLLFLDSKGLDNVSPQETMDKNCSR